MCKNILFAAVIALLSVIAIYGAQREPDLDTRFLPRPVTPETAPEGISSRLLRQSHVNGDDLVAVRLLSVNPTSCVWDEPITYDVEIHNITSQAITLPWALVPPDVPIVTGSQTIFSIISLSLHINGGGVLGEGQTLYGDPNNPSTVHQLSPNKSVVIRLPGVCHAWLNDRVIIEPGNSQSLAVYAWAEFQNNPNEIASALRSDTTLVTVSR